jgi:uncharacterized protein YrzB (UPF0473 family)
MGKTKVLCYNNFQGNINNEFAFINKKEVCLMTEERDDLVILIDEDGAEVEFEHLDTIEMNGTEYVVLLPFSETEEEQDVDEVVILKIEHNADGEDSFVSVEDEEALNSVFEEFRTRMEDEYEFDEE